MCARSSSKPWPGGRRLRGSWWHRAPGWRYQVVFPVTIICVLVTILLPGSQHCSKQEVWECVRSSSKPWPGSRRLSSSWRKRAPSNKDCKSCFLSPYVTLSQSVYQVHNTVGRENFESVCQELQQALGREQEAQRLLAEQSSRLEELGLQLNVKTTEELEKDHNITEAIKVQLLHQYSALKKEYNHELSNLNTIIL